jgi:excisionase family DNA binding protein
MTNPEHQNDTLTERSAVLLADGVDTPKTAAAFLKISVAQVYRLMEMGALPYTKIGRSRRIPRRALVELAARHLVDPGDA